MKAKLEYELPDEESEFKYAIKGGDAHIALLEIANQIFRPARKHGYSDGEIEKILDTMEAFQAGLGEDLIELLEEKFYQILKDHNLDIS